MVVIIWFSGKIKYRRKSVCALKMKYCSRIVKITFHEKYVIAQGLLWKELFFVFSESIFNRVQYDQGVGSSIETTVVVSVSG